jgi:hypothetical protein
MNIFLLLAPFVYNELLEQMQTAALLNSLLDVG